MEHYFELPVANRSEQLILKGRLVTFAYNYKFYIIVEGQELIFERDDKGQFRVTIEHNQPEIGQGLISNIVDVLEKISFLDRTA